MPDITQRRPLRAALLRYRAVVTITFPADRALWPRRKAGEMVDVPEWTAVEPGEPVPDDVIAFSPWLIRQGQVEPIPDDPVPIPEGGR